jgi:hypothetical protein
MAANAMPTHELKGVTGLKGVTEKRASESFAPLTLKERFGNLLREVFEGHEEYLGVTPD